MTGNTLPTFLPTSGGNFVPCYNIAGPLQIWGNTGSSGAVEFLGWTRGGIDIQESSFQQELKSDYSGGEQGPPDDYLWLGEMHMISAEMGRYNPGILAKYERRMNASVTNRIPGTLIGCVGGQFSVLFLSTNFGRLYNNVFITEPVSYSPIGATASFPRISFTGIGTVANTDYSPWKATGWTVSGAGVTFA